MKNPHNLQVGQEVYYVPGGSYRGKPRYLTITKIGHKYAIVQREWMTIQFDLQTLQEKTDVGCGGRLYLSEEAYLEEKEADSLWDKVRREVCYVRPLHLSSADIKRLLAILSGDSSSDERH